MNVRLLLVMIAIAAAAGAAVYWVVSADAPKAPRPRYGAGVELRPLDIDLGERRRGERIDFELSLANNGERPVHIASIDPGCGCTVVEQPAETVLRPRQSVTLAAELNTGNGLGPMRHAVAVYLEQGHPLRTYVTCTVIGAFYVLPAEVDFGEVWTDSVGEALERRFAFVSDATPPIEVAGPPVCGAAWLTCEAAGASPAGEPGFVVRIDPTRMEPGANFSEIHLATTDETEPQFAVTVRAMRR